MKRFTAYRKNISARGTHSEDQRNADHEPQFQGVIFDDGTCVLRWMTACKSTSMFASFEEMARIHGHPEYGTEIQFIDGDPHPFWIEQLRAYGQKLEAESAGKLRLVEVQGKLGLVTMYLEPADVDERGHVRAMGLFPMNEAQPL